MKRIILTLVMAMSLTFAPQAKAGVTDSSWFEPTILCVGAGAAGYAGASKGQEAMTAGLGCAAGALIGWLINSHYRSKYSNVYEEEINDLRKSQREMEILMATKASKGEEDNFSIRIQEVVPGKKLPDGSVMAPTFREKLVVPTEGTRIGD